MDWKTILSTITGTTTGGGRPAPGNGDQRLTTHDNGTYHTAGGAPASGAVTRASNGRWYDYSGHEVFPGKVQNAPPPGGAPAPKPGIDGSLFGQPSGISPADEQLMVNKGLEGVSSAEQDALMHSKEQAGAAGFGDSGSEIQEQNDLAQRFAGQKNAVGRDIRIGVAGTNAGLAQQDKALQAQFLMAMLRDSLDSGGSQGGGGVGGYVDSSSGWLPTGGTPKPAPAPQPMAVPGGQQIQPEGEQAPEPVNPFGNAPAGGVPGAVHPPRPPQQAAPAAAQPGWQQWVKQWGNNVVNGPKPKPKPNPLFDKLGLWTGKGPVAGGSKPYSGSSAGFSGSSGGGLY